MRQTFILLVGHKLYVRQSWRAHVCVQPRIPLRLEQFWIRLGVQIHFGQGDGCHCLELHFNQSRRTYRIQHIAELTRRRALGRVRSADGTLDRPRGACWRCRSSEQSLPGEENCFPSHIHIVALKHWVKLELRAATITELIVGLGQWGFGSRCRRGVLLEGMDWPSAGCGSGGVSIIVLTGRANFTCSFLHKSLVVQL